MDLETLDDDGLDAFFDAAVSQNKNREPGSTDIPEIPGALDKSDAPEEQPDALADQDQPLPDSRDDLPDYDLLDNLSLDRQSTDQASASDFGPPDQAIQEIAASLADLVDDLHVDGAPAQSGEDETPAEKPFPFPDVPLTELVDSPDETVILPGPPAKPGASLPSPDEDEEVPPWLAGRSSSSAPETYTVPPPTTIGFEGVDESGKTITGETDSDRILLADLQGKFIAVEPADKDGDPFVLVPAHVHTFVPWWGWLTIVLGLGMLVAGVILLPMISLNRTVAKLGDSNEAAVQSAMRQLVMNGDERTVKKLYSVASKPSEQVGTRLRAIDAMTLIERVPEVDRALLRLELSDSTHEQVREAASAARRQRAAARARRSRR